MKTKTKRWFENFSTYPPIYISRKESEIVFELKPYLQPFERILALAELKPFLTNGDKIKFFRQEAEEYFITETNTDIKTLIDRLAYWQRVGKETLFPTTQVLYEFSQDLMSGNGDNRKLHRARRLRYGSHDIHEYRGKFFPQLVRSLINFAGLKQGDTVIDRMIGSGTTLCEAYVLGMNAVGCDLNPLSVLIANIKSKILDIQPKQLLQSTSKLLKIIKKPVKFTTTDRWNCIELEYFGRWFAPSAIEDINKILTHIDSVSNRIFQDFFKMCLSNIIRGISWQKDTDLRVRKQILPYETDKAFSDFENQVKRQVNKLAPYLELVKSYKSKVDVYEHNSVKVDHVLPHYKGKCDLLITSPPYATALPYLDTDRLSLYILGLLPKNEFRKRDFEMIGNREVTEKQRKQLWELYIKRKRELPESVLKLIDFIADINHGDGVGFRRRNLPALLAKYFLDMKDAMESSFRMMKTNAYGFYVVGNNSTMVDGKKLEIHDFRPSII